QQNHQQAYFGSGTSILHYKMESGGATLLYVPLGSVVPCVDAGRISFLVEPDPVGFVDAASVRVAGARGKRRGDLDEAPLLTGDQPDFIRDFTEVLILAE